MEAEKAQNIYDLVEGFYELVRATCLEDEKLLDGETAEERTERSRENLIEILDEIEGVRE